jgi:hypothetical protein
MCNEEELDGDEVERVTLSSTIATGLVVAVVDT